MTNAASARASAGEQRFPAEGVLFDNDGVLVDSFESAAAVWDVWAATYAPDFDFRTQIVHGMRAEDLVAQLVAPERVAEAAAVLDVEEVRGAHSTVEIPGATALTASIPADRWAVVTSATPALGRARLEAAGHIMPPVLVTGADVENGKPHPDPYLLGAERLGVPIERCVVLEDAEAGVRAARAAGALAVIGVGDHLGDAVVDAHVDDLTAVTYVDSELVVQQR